MSKIFQYNNTLYVPYSAHQIYSVVNDIEHYAQFLPNCLGSGVVQRTPKNNTEVIQGYLDLNIMGTSHRLNTHNTHTPFETIEMNLLKGPFKRLVGLWEFQTINASEQSCKVIFHLEWEYNSAILALTVGQRFEGVAKELLDAFMAETKRRFKA